ncbi:MAG: biotin--[acetyl-CoA-carboxylase] ligase [Deltaproteobacteria bacterium]|nr:biotin--[acetyl-CoA-carboxylase] ligase [Deltaproteobacteria bacterium]
MSTKVQLLSYLKENRETWVSGESLSTKMAISRSAVWKHIKALRADGYTIESSPKKGYLFQKASDLLLPEEIREGLKTRSFGQQEIAYHRETDSTNLRAKELADQGAPEGTVVISEKQTSGRGRRGRSWFSPAEKGIYASLILRPSLPPNEAPKIVLLTSVAAAEALSIRTKLPVTIKWPNDILVKGKKIAGILIDIETEMDAVNYVIVGLGLNVNIPYHSLPESIRNDATSILIETGKQTPRKDIIREYLRLCEKYYEQFNEGRFQEILERWEKYANIIGQRIRVDLAGKTHMGNVSHIDPDGVLVIIDSDGRTHRIFSGDMTVMNEMNRGGSIT